MKMTAKLTNLGFLAALALVAGGLASPAFAEERQTTGGDQVELVYGTSFDLILQALEDNKFKGELTESDDGDPLIRSTDEEEPFSIHFYGCDDSHENCSYIQFVSGWNLDNGISFAKIEAWNQKKVWGQAYVDDKKDPWVAVTVNLDGGVTYDNFKDTVDWWRVVIRDFEEHIGWSK
jgi:hypothetical protein